MREINKQDYKDCVDIKYLKIHLTVELTAVELHADGGRVVPADGVEPDEASDHRREEGVPLRLGGVFVPDEHLEKEKFSLLVCSRLHR